MTARTRNRRAALLATSLLAAGVLGACGTESLELMWWMKCWMLRERILWRLNN